MQKDEAILSENQTKKQHFLWSQKSDNQKIIKKLFYLTFHGLKYRIGSARNLK